ncbi:hypothetical protein MBLNU459_g5729t2 [Dothideomycetes sp. NU459]
MAFVNKIFPPLDKRLNRKDPFWEGKGKALAIAITAAFISLQLLFLCNLSYIYGAFCNEEKRVHNINVLLVNYDNGVIGQGLEMAVKDFAAPTFLGIQQSSPSYYPTSSTIYDAVRSGEYWAAIYTEAGASTRLAAALSGGEAASYYNASNAITYIFNEARYATVADGSIESNIEQLLIAARVAYNHINGTQALQTMNTKDTAAIQALLNPIQPNAINIRPMKQGPRVLYNTVTFVLPIIMQFFFLMAINTTSTSFKLYSHLPLHDNGIIRVVLSLSYTLIGSMCFSAVIFAFRGSWDFTAGQFFLTWLTFWLYMHVNFLFMDVATAFVPAHLLGFIVLSWIIANVTSTIFPFELNPGFYRWAYALPAHETWQILIHIWSGGGGAVADKLAHALPVLFAWELLLLPCAKAALHHRCRAAALLCRQQEDSGAAPEAKSELVDRETSVSGFSTTLTAVE